MCQIENKTHPVFLNVRHDFGVNIALKPTSQMSQKKRTVFATRSDVLKRSTNIVENVPLDGDDVTLVYAKRTVQGRKK